MSASSKRRSHALQVRRTLSKAQEIYGTRERALAWLHRPNPRLRNHTPLELLESEDGRRRVEELLVQIDEGMFV